MKCDFDSNLDRPEPWLVSNVIRVGVFAVKTVQKLRRHLVRARDEFLHGRQNRELARQATEVRHQWMDATARRLPPLTEASDHPSVEVHTTCGEAQSGMGLWSSWSLMRFLPGARLVVHSDGSLTPDTIDVWSSMAPGAKFVSREENLDRMQQRFAAFPRIRAWSETYHFGMKIGGVYSVAESETVLEIDTDTLTLRHPETLRAVLEDPGLRVAWNNDMVRCYAYPEPLLREIAGPGLGPLPERLNGGYMIVRLPQDEDWAFMDWVLKRMEADPRTDPLRYWMHQTLWALLAARIGPGARPLPAAFDIHAGPTRPGSAMRHYVGDPGIRPRFFTEGVPSLIQDARVRGQLRPDVSA
jgi:hypothetical protein